MWVFPSCNVLSPDLLWLISVAMPGISWQQDCLQGSSGQHNMNCMTWSEDKEKVVNVICLLKCEAKKPAAAEEASSKMDKIKVRS